MLAARIRFEAVKRASPGRASITCSNARARLVRSTRRGTVTRWPHLPGRLPARTGDGQLRISRQTTLFGIRGEGRSATHRAAALIVQRFEAKLIHTHTFPLAEVLIRDPLRGRPGRRRDQVQNRRA